MNLVVDAMNANIATRKLDLLFGVLHKLVFGLERVAVIWVGALLVLDRSFSVGMLFAFFAYKEQFAQRVSGLIDKAVELRMLKLMLGIHEPQIGEVRVGGLPLAHLGLRSWRDMIGTVMQDDQLFAGSIIDNISFFDAQPDLAWIEECAKVASVHDEIEAMPMAYHTLIGDMGTSLSGGQKQRLLLARALYKRPKILFLDEATSALDVDRERLVNLAVRQLDLTRVIVAHRPETIASASRVIVLSDGRVAQDLRTLPGGSTASAH